ncbi:hypothetical protein SEA_NICEHOUSE_66 [Rhodococcus phage NiceHouse]|nr:hypothetical protein SEA_NICEHOUSE_66 [Rhodococcus phage NiceHouse]
MSKYSHNPYTVVNNYVLDFLEQEEVMDKTILIKGQAQPAMTPAGQTPELKDAASPTPERAPAFIVYSLELNQDENKVYADCETISYVIFSPKASKVMEIMYAIRDLFSHADWSAQALNAQIPEDKAYFHFLHTSFEQHEGPLPMEGEAGRFAGVVEVTYDYVKPIVSTPGAPKQGMRE